jgi:spore photoproduct lyase
LSKREFSVILNSMTSKITSINRKTMLIRESGRSSDFISPSFGYGCLFECSYCYMKRHRSEGLDVATNTNQILTEISNHAYFAFIEKPNQTDPVYVTYDISCNEDFALHAKYHDWKKIFQFFKDHPVAKATLATKTVPGVFLNFNPERKVRIRFSLMPQKLSSILEPNTARISDRLKAIDTFIDSGYDVHVNYSPVVYYKGWEEDYAELFQLMDQNVINKNVVKAEVIFLTHNAKKHWDNLKRDLPGEHLLWVPDIQERKTSQYGGDNVRYARGLKSDLIAKFKDIHGSIIPWNTIRYIF